MKTAQVDEFGDRVTKNGLFVYLYDLDAVIQTCEQVMKTQLGEYQYDKTRGIEYFYNVLTGTPNFQQFEAESRTQLLKIDGVISVTAFTYEQNENTLSYTATIKTIYGNGVANGNV